MSTTDGDNSAVPVPDIKNDFIEGRSHFAQIPAIICWNRLRLPYPAIVIYNFIIAIVGWRNTDSQKAWVYMGDTKISKKLEMNPRTAKHHLNLLVEMQLLFREKVPTSRRGRPKHIYRPNEKIWEENKLFAQQLAEERAENQRRYRELYEV